VCGGKLAGTGPTNFIRPGKLRVANFYMHTRVTHGLGRIGSGSEFEADGEMGKDDRNLKHKRMK